MLLKYIKSKGIDIASIGSGIVVLIAVLVLGGAKSDLIIYGITLFIVIVLFIYGIDYYRKYKSNKQLKLLQHKIIYELDEFPKANNANESLYQNIIKDLFIQNRREKEEFDKTKTETIDYYSLWAHQIKTPIAAIDILLQGTDYNNEKAHRELINDLKGELFKIEQYVDMVLSFLRINSDTSDYVIKKVNLDNVIKQTIRKYSKIFISKKIALNFHESNIEVVTDQKWLEFILEQIVSNALKYTNEGFVSIYAKNNHLVIEDTGIGIAPEDLPRIFEKGFTGYNGRTDRKSTGIGLYLCKAILTKLGHEISVYSQIGKGTIVKINFAQNRIKVE